MAIATSSITEWVTDGTGVWIDPGSGGGSSTNNDFFWSNGGSRARKVSNGIKGFSFQINASGQNMSGEVIAVRWATLAGIGAIDTRTLGGVALAVQDTAGNISYWDIDGADTYKGGWKTLPVDMAKTPSRNSGTAADLTIVEYIGILWDITTTVGGGDPNCYIDYIISWPQAGITLTGDSTAFIDDLVGVLDDTITGTDGGYALWERRSGVVFSKSRLILTPGAADFAESDRTLIFENPVYDAGSTIDSTHAELGMESADTDVISFTRCTIICADPDEAVTTDANREFDFTSATAATFDTCVIEGFDGTVIHLGGSGNSYPDCTFNALSQIVDTGAVVRRGFVRDTQNADGALLWTSSSDWQDTTFVMGVTDSNAIEYAISADLTDSWIGFTFSGYGVIEDDPDAVAHNSGANIFTINASDVTGAISERNSSTGDIIVINNVIVTLGNMKDDTEVRIYDNASGVELDGIENATAGSPDNREFAASVSGSTLVDIVIFNKQWIWPPNNRLDAFTWPSSTAALPIQQIFDRTFNNP